MKSILSDERECWFCHRTDNLHRHHIYMGANRKISEENGFTVYLCAWHHNLSNQGVHFNHEADLILKKACQRKYEQTHSRKEFMDLIGRNYL